MKGRLLAATLFLAGILCIVQQAHSQLTMSNVGAGFGVSGGGTPQVAFDAVGFGVSDGTATTVVTWTHTLAAGATELTVVASNYDTNNTPSSALVGVTSIPSAGTPVSSACGGSCGSYVFCLANPPTGLQTITLNYAVPNSIFMRGVSISATQSNVTTACRTQGSNTGSSNSTTVSPTSQVDDLVVDVMTAGTSSATGAGSGQTIELNYNGGAGYGSGVGVSYKNGAASSTPMTWSLAGSTTWGAAAVAIAHQ